ncbi:MAG: zinc ribbon domain-containing protein [Balneolaceae bacterium]|nr:MAG: zinc ribbon domain-containing protein [Balneolaceae bacterium]
MPTYEYKRKDGTVFEIIQGMNDEALATCPTTGQPVKRIISGGGGVVYKGTGWYVTDYKNGGQKNGADKSEPAGSKDKPAADSPKSTD